MRRLMWSSFICLTLAVVPAAAMLAAPVGATAPDLLVLRTGQGQSAALATVQADGPASQTLPSGMLDRSGHTLYAAQAQSDGTTEVQVIDVASGAVLRSLKMQGTFSTQSGDYAEGAVPLPWVVSAAAPVRSPALPARTAGLLSPGQVSAARSLAWPDAVRMPRLAGAGFPADGSQVLSALSFNARWLALREVTSVPGTTTHFIVIDTQRMRVVADHTLDGQFGLDAISADGKILYLIQSLPAVGFGVYQVRAFDVARGVLESKVIAERGERPGSMSGEAWTRVWSPDGAWLYTLYIESNGHAFVHALNLQARATECLDFPPIVQNTALMAHFTLSIAPDGRTLYAINSVLGVAVAIKNLPAARFQLVHLPAHAGGPVRMQDAAAISADGRSVFVATGTGVWVVDTRTLTLKRTYVPDQEVASVALSHDGRRLFALSPTSDTIDVLDPGSGASQGAMQPTANAWAIEGVS